MQQPGSRKESKMQNNVIPFDFKGNSVRVIMKDQDPWFVAKDVCNVLDVDRTTIRTLDEDETRVHSMHTSAGPRQMAIISEAGLYSLVLRSRKPQAKPFRRWVTHEVLPSIRKHGAYITDDKLEEFLNDPDTLVKLVTRLRDEKNKRREAERQIEEARPKVLFADAVSTSTTHILVGDLAKILKANGLDIGANRLFEKLREDGYLIKRKGSDWNMPTQRAMELGLFKVKETAVTHSDGHVTVNKTPKVTGKGQQYFLNRYLTGQDDRERVGVLASV